MFAPANGETVTIVRPGPPSRDVYGNDVPGTAVEYTVSGCGIAPTAGTEVVQGRDTITDNLTLYAPAGTDVRATDKVRVAGLLYEVSAPPNTFRSPFTSSAGPVVAALTLVTG